MVQIKEHFDSCELARAKAREALLPKKTMRSKGQLWNKYVVAMRIILPITASVFGLAALSWPLMQNNEVSFTLSREDVAKSDGVIRMQNLRYVGTMDDMQIFRLNAREGVQDTPDTPRIRLSDIEANLDLEDGVVASFSAGQGIYETKSEILAINEKVTLETTNGYKITMNGALINVKEQQAVGNGPVNGVTPIGTLSAGRVEVNADEEEANFLGGVKLHIIPRKK